MSNFHHVDMLEEIVQELEEATWERVDEAAKCYLCTRAPGPPWNLVYRRVTYDLKTKEVIQDVLIEGITNKQRQGPLPEGHKDGTRTVFYYRRPKGTTETVGNTRDEQFIFEEPTEGEAPERQVTSKAKSTPVTAKEVLATQGSIREKW
eukprot:1674740-Amphidinium_carterae.1